MFICYVVSEGSSSQLVLLLSLIFGWTLSVKDVSLISFMTYVCADNVQMMCGWHADDMCVCGWHADDTRCSTAWNWATQASVWMTFRMTYVIRQWNLTRNLTLVSSAHHLHVVRTRLQSPKYFQLNTRATALLKIKQRYYFLFELFILQWSHRIPFWYSVVR